MLMGKERGMKWEMNMKEEDVMEQDSGAFEKNIRVNKRSASLGSIGWGWQREWSWGSIDGTLGQAALTPKDSPSSMD